MSQEQPQPSPYEIDTQSVARERASRLMEFYATLFVLTPRIFVTHTIIVVNVLLFVMMVVKEPQAITSPTIESLIFWGANNGALTLNSQPWRLLTCMFLHIGIIHIAINMWILWDIGRLMERVVGNVGFTLLYVVSGLCGSLASIAWNPQMVSAGASGAVFGLFGGLLGFLMLGRGSMPPEVSNSFRSSAMTFIGYNLVFGFIIPGVDNAAHIGGLLGGCLCGLCLGQPLTLDTAGRRWPRNLLVLVLGGGITAAGLLLLPKPADVDGALRNFSKVEADAVDKYNGFVREIQAGKLTVAEFAEGVENQVLPPWREARRRMEDLKRIPPRVQPYVAANIKYALAREAAWESQILVNREATPERMAAYKECEQQLAAATAELERIAGELK